MVNPNRDVIPLDWEDNSEVSNSIIGWNRAHLRVQFTIAYRVMYERMRGEQESRRRVGGGGFRVEMFPIIVTLQFNTHMRLSLHKYTQIFSHEWCNMHMHVSVWTCVCVCVYVTLCHVLHNPQIFHFVASSVRGREHGKSWRSLLHLQTHTM